MPRLSKIGAAALAAFGWTAGASVTANYLVVAGGGGGGGGCGGGGGAGGYRTSTLALSTTQTYTITVGGGGAGAIGGNNGGTGNDSVISGSGITTITSSGGGYSSAASSGGSGGSGGGSGYYGTAGAGNTPSTSPSQGNNGGSGFNNSGNYFAGGGGGGSGSVGGTGFQSGVTTYAGNGGSGTASSISGTSVTYAGGGGASGYSLSGSLVLGTGYGGGGNGSGFGIGGNGTANFGGGGGSGGYPTFNGGSGGSGIVIISYAGAQQFGGGVVTSVGGNTIHTFTTSGTLSPLSSLTASYLIVAGGGGGGSNITTNSGGGGGAGGLLSGASLTIDTNSIYAVTVGAGGAGSSSGGTPGTNGSSSTFSLVSTTAVGGGGGGDGLGNANAVSGGSGGGGGSGSSSSSGASGTSGQGNAGGNGAYSSPGYPGGGGGGAGAVGGNATSTTGGNGGAGTASSISGSSVTYAGGGGGGAGAASGTAGGTGGAGGGGNGAVNSTPQNGTANRGGGGGGVGYGAAGSINGGSGGSGIVIISYPGSTPQMAGGTVTAAGGNIIHTFTSSGYLSPIVNVNNSLRFRSSATAYLNRTGTNTTAKTWTFSAWVKRGKLSSGYPTMMSGYNVDENYATQLFFGTDDTLQLYNVIGGTLGNGGYAVTSARFRDPSAWYHVVYSIDTTQSSAANAFKIYVNGVQQTLGSSGYGGGTNQNTYINYTQRIGLNAAPNTDYFDGYMADINFIDGQALTPFSFGSFNGLGVWQPIRYGGSYGTNGFYLPFNAGTATYAGTFSGSNYLTVPDSSVWAFSGNWTVEAFFYVTNFSSTLQSVVAQWVDGGGGDRAFTLGVNSSSQLQTYVQYGGNQYALTSSSAANLIANTWYHAALVVNGTTLTLYLNGVAVSSTTVSGSINNSSAPVGIGAYGNGSWKVTGGISNVRITNTAVYTSNFTVPTANLTAISGTQLLTCQNATFVDNSSNAFTITNNGSVTTAQNYPFSASRVYADQGPAGNNWTPNNISGQSGSTLDYMTDVPTNTSATVANYAVLNPLAMYGTNAVISNANLTSSATSSSNDRGWASTIAAPSEGKWYAEFTFTATNGDNNGGCGVMLENGTGVPGESATTVSWRDFGTLRQNASSTSYGSALTTNDIVIVAYDAALGRVWFGKNGTWFASGDPATNANPSATGITTSGRFATYHYNTAAVIQANFGQQPFAYTPPTGFKALNTYNLPTPTIGATPATTANNYFNAVLYSGNNSTQTITTGFQPDFIWSKCRNVGRSHRLIDSVRGLSYQLFSDSTDGGSTYDATSYVSSITSTSSSGFAVTNAGTDQYNTSGENYVSWAWKANGSGSTNTAGSITSTVSANTTAGFSIVTYTGTGANATVGHGLGVALAMMIIKTRSLSGENWWVWHQSLPTPTTSRILLNLTNAYDPGASTYWNNAVPTSTVFSLGNGSGNNGSGATYVAYCFAEVAGYSRFGSYTGNGSADGPFVFTGFRPRFILFKNASSAGTVWVIFDTARNTYNFVDSQLRPNESSAENSAGSSYSFDILSNGFKVRSSDSNFNGSGDTMIYAAFAESPFKYANAR